MCCLIYVRTSTWLIGTPSNLRKRIDSLILIKSVLASVRVEFSTIASLWEDAFVHTLLHHKKGLCDERSLRIGKGREIRSDDRDPYPCQSFPGFPRVISNDCLVLIRLIFPCRLLCPAEEFSLPILYYVRRKYITCSVMLSVCFVKHFFMRNGPVLPEINNLY